jgi:predicted anti-sigma-YlaC factor YlaD
VTDYYYVDCEEYREALSARLDDEEGPEDARQPSDLDLHLECCVDCALWYNDAALITRRTRTTAAVAWPDVTDAVLARVPAGTSLGSTGPRMALGTVGAVQGVSALFALAFHSSVEPVVGYDTAAWNLALGVAFSAVAARRTQPAGLVPLLGAFVAVLSWGLVSGQSSGGGLGSYVLTALGFVLVVLLGRVPPVRRGPAPPASSAAGVRRRPVSDIWDDGVAISIRRTEPTKAA